MYFKGDKISRIHEWKNLFSLGPVLSWSFRTQDRVWSKVLVMAVAFEADIENTQKSG